MSSKVDRRRAIEVLWNKGILKWKLHDVQKEMYKSIIEQKQEITTITCARRLGKSYLLCIMAVEMCLSKPNAIVKYACPKRKMVKTIIKPIMTEILKDCPPELKPSYKTNDGLYEFPNGSQIQLAGTDNGHHESIRGGYSDLWIVDEAGFCDELNYVVNTILAPTTDTTGGRGILASTPSKMPDHEFITEFVNPSKYNDSLIKYTIHDNPMMTKEKIQSIIGRYTGGENNPEYQREYLCKIVIDDSLAIVPEFTEAVEKDVVTSWPKPPFYDSYVSMDIGFKDLTVALFAYHDFKNNVLVIEDELVMNGPTMTTDVLAEKIREKERTAWTHPMTLEFKDPFLRVCDNNLIMINDLSRLHNLTFLPTAKDDKSAAINNMRMKIASRQIAIHPRCETLVKHLKSATWQKNRKEYARSPDNGHYDAIDALVYLIRNVLFDKNPYPAGYGIERSADLFLSPHRKEDERFDKWKSLFKPRKSLKN